MHQQVLLQIHPRYRHTAASADLSSVGITAVSSSSSVYFALLSLCVFVFTVVICDGDGKLRVCLSVQFFLK